MLTFGLKGGFDAGVKFYDALALIKRLVNIGDAKSLAAHPASTTHRQLNDEELERAGVPRDMAHLMTAKPGSITASLASRTAGISAAGSASATSTARLNSSVPSASRVLATDWPTRSGLCG